MVVFSFLNRLKLISLYLGKTTGNVQVKRLRFKLPNLETKFHRDSPGRFRAGRAGCQAAVYSIGRFPSKVTTAAPKPDS